MKVKFGRKYDIGDHILIFYIHPKKHDTIIVTQYKKNATELEWPGVYGSSRSNIQKYLFEKYNIFFDIEVKGKFNIADFAWTTKEINEQYVIRQ